MVLLQYILWVCAAILVFYACFPAVSLLAASVTRRRSVLLTGREQSIACIITAYKQCKIALPQIESLLRQRYGSFHIYLVADHYAGRLEVTPHPALTILYPEPYLNSKVLSIKYAMDRFGRAHDAVLILDADNLLHPDALAYLNSYLESGFVAVQGQRTAKNLDTTMAVLDALGELYYNTTQRETPFRIGSSATIAGSGMAVSFDFFSRYIQRMFGEGKQFEIAEDKLLQMMLAESRHRIAWCREALIFDEKVAHGSQIQRQRTRWIRSWFQHWGTAMRMTGNGLLRFDWNMFYFGLMLSFPPMFILTGGLVFTALAGIPVDMYITMAAVAGLLVFTLQFVLALAVAKAPAPFWRVLPSIPALVWRQILAVLKIKASKKDFLATDHSKTVGIDEVWEKRKFDFPYMPRD
jgi:cellulose synthase/poly-beta-1,6-N-acetylglucosamine synthase-like glycosyltransferase